MAVVLTGNPFRFDVATLFSGASSIPHIFISFLLLYLFNTWHYTIAFNLAPVEAVTTRRTWFLEDNLRVYLPVGTKFQFPNADKSCDMGTEVLISCQTDIVYQSVSSIVTYQPLRDQVFLGVKLKLLTSSTPYDFC